MKDARKKGVSFIARIPIVSWYFARQRNGYSLDRAGKGLSLSDALMK